MAQITPNAEKALLPIMRWIFTEGVRCNTCGTPDEVEDVCKKLLEKYLGEQPSSLTAMTDTELKTLLDEVLEAGIDVQMILPPNGREKIKNEALQKIFPKKQVGGGMGADDSLLKMTEIRISVTDKKLAKMLQEGGEESLQATVLPPGAIEDQHCQLKVKINPSQHEATIKGSVLYEDEWRDFVGYFSIDDEILIFHLPASENKTPPAGRRQWLVPPKTKA